MLFHLVWLNNNKFTGSIPSDIAILRKLTDLQLYNNDLTGAIPKEIGSLKRLGKCGSNYIVIVANVFYSLTFSC